MHRERTLEEALGNMLAAYPSNKATADTVSIYLDALADLSEPVVIEAIGELIRSKTFLPTIAEVRNAAYDRATWLADANPSSPWKMVLKQMAERVPGDGKGPWELPPFVMEVVKAIGTWELRTNPKAPDLFRQKYQEMRESLVLDVVRGRISLEEMASIVGNSGNTPPSLPEIAS